jgi:Flp pilus assembly protein TadD
VQGEEIRDSHSFYFFTGQSPVLRVLPRMAILFPLACVGALAMARRRTRASLLAYHAAAGAAGPVLLVLGMRYRMPLVPALAIAAGAGLTALADSVAARRIRDVSLYASVAIVAVLISHLQSDPQNRNPAEEWAFTGSSLVTEHNLPAAEAAYQRALSLDQRSGFAWDGLGLVQYDAGRLGDARQAFDRALALDPDSARATFHIALVDERDGRAPQAIAGYARALALSPYDAEIAGHLGTALGMAGRIEEARTQFRRVVELTPSNGEAWLDLCLLSLDSHDVEGASAALQHAREWGATPDRLTFASEALARATSQPSRDD